MKMSSRPALALVLALALACALASPSQGGPFNPPGHLSDNGESLLALAALGTQNPGLAAGSLDRLFDAAKGRNFSTDAALPQRAKAPTLSIGAWKSAAAHIRPKSRFSGLPLPQMAKQYQRTFRILMSRHEQIDQFDSLIVKYSQKYRLNPTLLKSIIAAESEFNITARSPAGAMGLMQLMPATAECMGVPREQLFDPEANIRAGSAYLAYLFKIIYKRSGLTGSYAQAPQWVLQRVIAAYNAGMRFLKSGRQLYRETRHYVAKVLLYNSSLVSKIRH